MTEDRGPSSALGDRRRGVSEVIGVVLLFGLVVAGAALVALTWTSAQATFQEHGRVESAETAVQEFDTKLADITGDGAPKRASFDLTDREGDGESVHLESDDSVTVALHDGDSYRSDCRTTLPLQELVYDVDDETTLTYQAGGVFRTEGNHTEVVTEPSIGFDDGTVELTVTTFDGSLSDDAFEVTHEVTRSQRVTSDKRAALFGNGTCRRPDRVRLTVDTDDPTAWADHLREQTPDGASVTVAGTTVTAEINDSALVAAVDDDRNHVVDFASGSVAGTVTSSDDGVDLWVNKGTDNDYRISARLLGAQFGQTSGEVTESTKNITGTLWRSEDGRPLDIVFLVDESGSMRGDIGDARPPIRNFLSRFPRDQAHRASVIGFGGGITVHQGLTTDRTALAETVEDFGADGGTPMAAGLREALDRLDDTDSSERNRAIVLMTDGHANGGYPDDAVERANRENVSVYTLGFDEADVDTLSEVAISTGGIYADVDGLEWVSNYYEYFVEDLGYEIENGTVDTRTVYNLTESLEIVHEPVVLEHRLDGETTWEPVVSGATTVQRAVNYQEYVTAVPSLPDGEVMNVRASMYDCADRTLSDPASKPVPANTSVLVRDTNGESPVIKSKYRYEAYDEYRCTDAGTGRSPSTVRTFTDGDSVPSSSSPGWQTDFEEMVAPYVDGGTFDLESNQVIVAYGDHGTNSLNGAVVLYRVGKPTAVSTEFVVDLDVEVVDPEG